MKKLYIIGNGFDLAHNLPTRFDPNFKDIARKHEQDNFWDIYQSHKDDIWSDFENLLGCPDYNALEEIFNDYAPDYTSDRERDRNSIIMQVDLNGNLRDALEEFASTADSCLSNIQANDSIKKLLDIDGCYITFNYTHTLEETYQIPNNHVLHIHGEVGKRNLELGYPEGNYSPEKYFYDVRMKGTGPYREMDIEDYINDIEDYYVRTAYGALVTKCKSFYKEIKVELLENFLNRNACVIEEIIVYGHSCAIDFDYFSYLNTRYPDARWKFFVKDDVQKYNVQCLIEDNNIINTKIIEL